MTDINKKENYVRPAAANRKWCSAKAMSQTIYMYGVAGTGKTSFVLYNLKNKNHVYYSLADTNAANIKADMTSFGNNMAKVIVIDDLQMAVRDEDQELLCSIIMDFTHNPEIWLILISRAKVPSWLMHIYIEEIFTVIEERDFWLKKEDIRKYLGQWQLTVSEETLDLINNNSRGNGAMLRLIAIELSNGSSYEEADRERLRIAFYDYLEYHVYDRWDIDLLEFLMQISIVESFDEQLAEMISGRQDVPLMIKRALEIGNFLNLYQGIYTYEEPMKNSMRRRLHIKYTKDQIKNLYYNAGLYYEMHRDNLNALHMYEESDNNERIYGLLVANARENPASGQYFELKNYYLMLPEQMLIKSPELMAGMSMLHSLLLNPEESERWYSILKEYSRQQHGSDRRQAENRLLYLDISLPHRGSLQLADLFKNAGTLIRERKVILPELSITSNLPSMMNGGKDFCEWSKKDTELAKSIGKLLELAFGAYGKGFVNLALAETSLEKGRDSYEVSSLANRGRMQAENGGKTEQCFVGIGILSWLYIINGHPDEADELLSSFREQVIKENLRAVCRNLDTFRCRVWLYKGELAKVIEWLDTAPDEKKEFFGMERFRYLTKIRVYIIQGAYDKAQLLLSQLEYFADINNRTYVSMEVMLLRSIVMYRIGDKLWQEVLQQVLTLAEEFHFVRIFSREGTALWEMLRNRKWEWKDEDFKKQVLAETEKVASYYPSYLKEKTFAVNDFSENALNVLRLQSEGLSNKAIAEKLGIKPDNVKYHSKENYRKLGVNGKAAAVVEARKRNLIS